MTRRETKKEERKAETKTEEVNVRSDQINELNNTNLARLITANGANVFEDQHRAEENISFQDKIKLFKLKDSEEYDKILFDNGNDEGLNSEEYEDINSEEDAEYETEEYYTTEEEEVKYDQTLEFTQTTSYSTHQRSGIQYSDSFKIVVSNGSVFDGSPNSNHNDSSDGSSGCSDNESDVSEMQCWVCFASEKDDTIAIWATKTS